MRSLAAQFLVNGFVYATFVARLPEIRDRVGISIGVLGVVLTVGSLSALVGSLFTGHVIAWLGSRRVMVAGGLLYVGALPLIGFSTSPVVLVAGMVALMFFDVFIDVAMNLQASVLSARRHPPVMNRLHGLWSLGTLLGGLVAVQVAGAGVEVPVHYTAAAVGLAVTIALVAPGLLPVDEPHPEQEPAQPPSGRRGWRPGRGVLVLGSASAMAVTLDVTAGEWAAFRLADDLGATPGMAAAAVVAYTAGMTVGRFGGDVAVARLGRAALTRVGAVVGGAGLALATLVPSRSSALAGFVIAGLGASVLEPQLADAAARAPGRPGSGFAVLFVGHRVAALLTPALIGGLANGERVGVGAAMAIVSLPAAALLVVVAGTAIRRQPPPSPGESGEDGGRGAELRRA